MKSIEENQKKDLSERLNNEEQEVISFLDDNGIIKKENRVAIRYAIRAKSEEEFDKYFNMIDDNTKEKISYEELKKKYETIKEITDTLYKIEEPERREEQKRIEEEIKERQEKINKLKSNNNFIGHVENILNQEDFTKCQEATEDFLVALGTNNKFEILKAFYKMFNCDVANTIECAKKGYGYGIGAGCVISNEMLRPIQRHFEKICEKFPNSSIINEINRTLNSEDLLAGFCKVDHMVYDYYKNKDSEIEPNI